ncbi:hypothetical protein KUTeg_012490 [Tegillarca granosa]|uniref:Uncharacterized protein n=1 Tax=Tegillarca granosa TaxID=220873 RepID=A0ABQ9EZP0_TEGGR|nr:hypothetical protein KUTeg_012490 [Tegillarca granosa]
MDFFVQIVLFIVYLISSVEGYCSYSGYYECPDGVYCCPYGTICSGAVCLNAAVVVIPVLIIIAIIVTVIIYILRRQNCRKRMKEKRGNAVLKAENVLNSY